MVWYAVCRLCNKNLLGQKNIWRPWCLICHKLIKSFTTCTECTSGVYNIEKHSIKNSYRTTLNLCCGNCSGQIIGFDNRLE